MGRLFNSGNDDMDRMMEIGSYLNATDQLPTPKKKKGGIPGSLLLILIVLVLIGAPILAEFIGRVAFLITDGVWTESIIFH